MTAIVEIAERFFDACETGQGWQECQQYCHQGATFSAQAAALEGVDSLQVYTEWMKGLLTPLPDGRAEVRSFALDEARTKSWPTACSMGAIRARAARLRRQGRSQRPITSTTWPSRATRSAT